MDNCPPSGCTWILGQCETFSRPARYHQWRSWVNSVFYNPGVAVRVLGEEGSLNDSKNYDDLTRDSYNRCRCTRPM